MSARDRQRGIVDAATSIFAARGFGGATTAAIANEAGVNESLLFRHFGSKSALYVASIDTAWALVRDACEQHFAAEPAGEHWRVPGRSFLELLDTDPMRARVWIRALVETTGVPDIDQHLEALMREVHAYVREAFQRSIEVGAIRSGKDAGHEAWLVVAIGLLGSSLATRGIIDRRELEGVVALHTELVLS